MANGPVDIITNTIPTHYTTTITTLPIPPIQSRPRKLHSHSYNNQIQLKISHDQPTNQPTNNDSNANHTTPFTYSTMVIPGIIANTEYMTPNDINWQQHLNHTDRPNAIIWSLEAFNDHRSIQVLFGIIITSNKYR